MKGYSLNKDKEYVSKIIDGIYRRGGHCPCRRSADETTLCPCDEFVLTGKCLCKLFVADGVAETKNN